MPKVLHMPDSGGTKEIFNIIIGKLHATVAMHKATFPQLATIEKFLDVTLPEAGSDEVYLEKLDEICSSLHELSVSSYIIRHLHHNVCADVDAVKNNSFTFYQEEYYIILPK
ncbi:hypothetical protein ACFS7Z_24835 [Pontibacter toksunensis]|uniref:Uncharacterized protein n=1 Tax=Pontibacter toksunensis TaxID=1332631 RepID=A0ABW6C2C0_9BACT